MSVTFNANSVPVMVNDVYSDAYHDAYSDVYKDEYNNDAYYRELYNNFSDQAYNQAYNDFVKGTRRDISDEHYVYDESVASAEDMYYDVYYDTYYKQVYNEVYNDAYNKIYEDSIKGNNATRTQIAFGNTASSSDFFSLLNLNPVFFDSQNPVTSPNMNIMGDPLANFALFLGQPILPTLSSTLQEVNMNEALATPILLEKDVFG